MAVVIALFIGLLFLVSGGLMFFSPRAFVALFDFFNPGARGGGRAQWRRSPSDLNFRLLGLMMLGAGLWVVISMARTLLP